MNSNCRQTTGRCWPFRSAELCERAGRNGFSLLELVTALSIIALLMAILVPAVQSVREVSRRNQCANHLRQLGVAFNGFEAIHAHYPAHSLSPKGAPPRTPYKWNPVHMQLLPFVDQMTVYQKIDFNRPSPDSRYVSGLPHVANVQIPAYKCPSNGSLTGISYRGCTGYGPDIFEKGYWPGGQGTFVEGDGLLPKDFRDGLSQTVAFSEKIPSDNSPAFGTGDFWYTGLPALLGRGVTAEEGINALIKTCGSLTGPPTFYHAHAGRTWYLPRYGFTLYNHALAPNSDIADCSGDLIHEVASEDVRGSSIGLFTATSYHPGGVHVLYCDGHAEFVSDNIDQSIWRAISTRGGKEILDF